jgi:hypothetical protein
MFSREKRIKASGLANLVGTGKEYDEHYGKKFGRQIKMAGQESQADWKLTMSIANSKCFDMMGICHRHTHSRSCIHHVERSEVNSMIVSKVEIKIGDSVMLLGKEFTLIRINTNVSHWCAYNNYARQGSTVFTLRHENDEIHVLGIDLLTSLNDWEERTEDGAKLTQDLLESVGRDIDCGEIF